MIIRGKVKKDRKTKNLVKRLKLGDIALISHRDLDEIAATSLVEKKVKCVINLDETISGKYPNQGPSILLKAGIPIFETDNEKLFDLVNEGDTIEVNEDHITRNDEVISSCHLLDAEDIKRELGIGYKNLEEELDKFIENTLEYAKKEKGLVTGNLKIPKIKTKIDKRHVLVVVRGKDYKRDLEAIQAYINEVKPILIGVDGGGDAILEFGQIPDIVIGDMDSISDRCLKAAKEIVVHAYPNGEAPGLKRVKELGLEAVVFPAPGTSEDIALLLAYSNNADLIVAVGTHNNMIDFLEKGRKGMASTFLVRLKVGAKLIDAKGVNKLYHGHLKMKYIIGLAVAALLPIIVITLMFPPMRELIALLKIRLRIMFGL
ncbi:putative cytokinetic ring protein SteA [Sporanaerobacter sp. PP17-6a]|jgi:uncharacterized membrane-anchored protein|uniref:putative cytokinetic ring protein SteA n=1 Tax=Sporanaerobacter sp. PP17-6a TaxID=1891289 RepID=UPI00089F95A3|nr:putative cytokinetic ring protein SteA [Sporanaerobacter sp. PP17-6a]MBE6082068.1 hypothetical protein [Tissierellaceae bacterium]SCL82418.1 thiamine pyrophosphokinase [Sporanaerobacter sp. PP17-6a]